MSSATGPCISTNNRDAFLAICTVGLFSTAVQNVYFRECLSVFSGNEVSIGMILAVWLAVSGAGLMLGGRAARPLQRMGVGTAAAVLAMFAAAGITVIRASRLVFLPGEIMGPLQMTAVLVAGEVPFAFVNGVVLRVLFAAGPRQDRLYAWESAGTVAGSLCVFACILAGISNSTVLALCGVPLLAACRRHPLPGLACCAALGLAAATGPASLQWKYNVPVHRILYGREGEIVTVGTGSDTTFLLNGELYKSTMQKATLEQAVDIPMGQRTVHRALVVFDRGHTVELAKYPGCHVDVVETEPALATAGARIAAVETLHPPQRYDVVFLGTGLPHTASSNRFYTHSFFSIIKSFLTDSGIVTFTLPFSENYFSRSEKKLYDALRTTLSSVFTHVLVFPGEGYTFMASEKPLSRAWSVRVPTSYLAASAIPAASGDRVSQANAPPTLGTVNTRDRPLALLLALENWTDLFGAQILITVILAALCLGAAIVLVPKTRAALSVGTTGFVLGGYSVCILLIYQATYGALYSRVALLLVALTAGFTAGAFVRWFPLSDFAIGLYCTATLAALALVPSPWPVLVYAFHAGAGVLCGAQIASRPGSGLATLYAADLFGGALGMALCSTVLAPLFGVVPVAAGIIAIKAAVEFVNMPKA